MPFFPDPVETSSDVLTRMRARAFRAPNDGIECVLQWEAKERGKPVSEGLSKLSERLIEKIPEILSDDIADEEVEKRKLLLMCTDEFSKRWKEVETSIDENTFESNGSIMFSVIDEYREAFDILLSEFEALGVKIEKYKVTMPEAAPERVSLKSLFQKIDYKKVLWGAAGVAGLWWITTHKDSFFNLGQKKEEPSTEKPKKDEIRIGPPALAKTWEKPAESPSLAAKSFGIV